ncbi:glycosyltransferase, partial [bacterium]|nr:glycosyltransferase [bacterium]
MSKGHKFVYVTAVDISVNDGPGINEREFVKELLNNFDDSVTCVLQKPACPENFNDPRVEYVMSHRRHNPVFWLLYTLTTVWRVMKLNRKHCLDALVFRIDIVPLVEILLTYIIRKPVFLKTVAGGAFKPRKIVRLVHDLAAPLRTLILRKATAMDSVGLTSKDWVVDTYGVAQQLIEVIPNGVNVKMFNPLNSQESKKALGLNTFDFVVGYVGALRATSCLEDLIQAIQKVREQHNVGLVLVGEGPQRACLEGLVEELALQEVVMIVGAIPYTDVPKYMSSFDIAVDLTANPIKMRKTVAHASYSQKIAQYLACGSPVLAWDMVDTVFLKEQ